MTCRYCEAELNGTHAESCPLAQAKKRSLPYVEYDPRKETPEDALKRARHVQADLRDTCSCSLRDQFAMAAPIQMSQNTLGHYADNARDRYEWADAMLEERKKIHEAKK